MTGGVTHSHNKTKEGGMERSVHTELYGPLGLRIFLDLAEYKEANNHWQ